MGATSLLQNNIDYFNKELLPYYVILHTSKGAIVVDIKEENLKQLLPKINELLTHHLKVEYGKFGKNTLQIYKNDVLIEPKEKVPNECTNS